MSDLIHIAYVNAHGNLVPYLGHAVTFLKPMCGFAKYGPMRMLPHDRVMPVPLAKHLRRDFCRECMTLLCKIDALQKRAHGLRSASNEAHMRASGARQDLCDFVRENFGYEGAASGRWKLPPSWKRAARRVLKGWADEAKALQAASLVDVEITALLASIPGMKDERATHAAR